MYTVCAQWFSLWLIPDSSRRYACTQWRCMTKRQFSSSSRINRPATDSHAWMAALSCWWSVFNSVSVATR